jgi:hypothetical protein
MNTFRLAVMSRGSGWPTNGSCRKAACGGLAPLLPWLTNLRDSTYTVSGSTAMASGLLETRKLHRVTSFTGHIPKANLLSRYRHHRPWSLPKKPATVLGIITRPVVGASLLVVILALALLPVYIRRRRNQDKASSPDGAETEELSVALESAPARAKLVLPNGIEIRLSGKDKVIGRGDLARALSLDDLGLISKRHFEIKSDDEQFYIEDLGSANGTRLNGKDISGQGPVGLDDDDIIEPAGAIPLKFHLL